MITPVDLQNRDFRKALRGYDVHDVDEFFDRVTAEFERVFRANVQYRDEIEALKRRIDEYGQIEATLRDTLMLAQDTSQQLRVTTAKEADLVVAEAKERARRIVDGAEESIRSKKADLEELRKREELFRIQFRSILEAYLTSVETNGVGSLLSQPATAGAAGYGASYSRPAILRAAGALEAAASSEDSAE